MEIVSNPAPPTGLRRVLWRLPVQLYRLRLGGLLGARFLLLRHTGRVSGQPRTAVLEVVERADGSWTVASGFGSRSDWYRNILANPEVSIRTSGADHEVTAVALPIEDGARIMARYGGRHPRSARSLARIMGMSVDGSPEDWREVGRRIPFVQLRSH